MERTISPEQAATRRRALGRRMAKQASDLRIIAMSLRDNPDGAFLEAAEGKSLEKQLDTLDKIAGNLDKLRERLDTP